jgi:hypothetical protein
MEDGHWVLFINGKYQHVLHFPDLERQIVVLLSVDPRHILSRHSRHGGLMLLMCRCGTATQADHSDEGRCNC